MYFPKVLIERLIRDGNGLENRPMVLAIKQDQANMATVLPYAAKKGATFMIGDD